MRISVVYHSESGNTRQVATLIAQGAGEVQGVEARIMGLEELDREFIKGSAAVIFGCPLPALPAGCRHPGQLRQL